MSKTKVIPRGQFQYLRVSVALEANGVTLDDVARSIDRGRSTVYKWFADDDHRRNPPRADDLASIAVLAGLSTDACMGLD